MSTPGDGRIYSVRKDRYGKAQTRGHLLPPRKSLLAARLVSAMVPAQRAFVDTPDGRVRCDLYFDVSDDTGFALVVEAKPADDRQLDESDRTALRRIRDTIIGKFSRSESPSADGSISVLTQFVQPELMFIASDSRTGSLRTAIDAAHVLVLGDPGAGKTTSLRHLACDAVTRDLTNVDSIPAYIQLRDYIDRPFDLDVALNEAWGLDRTATQRIRKKYNVQYFLDGLDEMPQSMQADVAQRIHDFERNDERSRFVVSCRSSSYSGWFDDHVAVAIQPWSNGQISQYIDYFHGGSRTDRYFSHLDSVLSYSYSTQICSSPLLLNMAVRSRLRESSRPDPYSDMARVWTEGLLEHWDRTRAVQRHDRPQQRHLERRLLHQLSILAIDGNEATFTPDSLHREGIAATIDEAADTLRSLAHVSGVLSADRDGTYHFTHRMFAEFLAAEWLVTSTKDARDLFKSRSDNRQWVAVLAIAARLTSDSNDLAEIIVSESDSTSWQSLALLLSVFTEPLGLDDVVEQAAARVVGSLAQQLFGKIDRTDISDIDLSYALAPSLRISKSGSRDGWTAMRCSVDAHLIEQVSRVTEMLRSVAASPNWPRLSESIGDEAGPDVAALLDLVASSERVVVGVEQTDDHPAKCVVIALNSPASQQESLV